MAAKGRLTRPDVRTQDGMKTKLARDALHFGNTIFLARCLKGLGEAALSPETWRQRGGGDYRESLD